MTSCPVARSTTAFDGRGDASEPVPLVEGNSEALPLGSTPIDTVRAFRFRGRGGRLFFMAYVPYTLTMAARRVRAIKHRPVNLYSRPGNDLTDRFPLIVDDAPATLTVMHHRRRGGGVRRGRHRIVRPHPLPAQRFGCVPIRLRPDRWEPVRALKKDPRTRHIPIIGMSAYAEASEREKAMTTGCDGFDAKPIEFESLVATVRRVLAKPK
jgi:hypothetical protein